MQTRELASSIVLGVKVLIVTVQDGGQLGRA